VVPTINKSQKFSEDNLQESTKVNSESIISKETQATNHTIPNETTIEESSKLKLKEDSNDLADVEHSDASSEFNDLEEQEVFPWYKIDDNETYYIVANNMNRTIKKGKQL